MKSSINYAIDGEYIREWLVLGPFFPDDLETDFLAHVGGEATIEPKEGDTVGFDGFDTGFALLNPVPLCYSTQATSDGKTLTWILYKSEEDVVNLVDAVGSHEHATAYAFCVLHNETAGDAQIYLGSDDGVAVWINGEQAHHNPVARELVLDQDVFEVNLKAGANRCLIKVSNGVEAWGFAMRVLPPDRAVISGTITDEEGEPIAYSGSVLGTGRRKDYTAVDRPFGTGWTSIRWMGCMTSPQPVATWAIGSWTSNRVRENAEN